MVSNSEIFPNTLRNWTTRYPKVCQILLYPSCSTNHPSICPMSQRCKPPLQSGKKRSRMPSWPNFFSNQKKQHSTETTHRYQTIAIFKRELPFPNHHFGYPAVRFRENNLLIVFHVRSCFFFFFPGAGGPSGWSTKSTCWKMHASTEWGSSIESVSRMAVSGYLPCIVCKRNIENYPVKIVKYFKDLEMDEYFIFLKPYI